MLHHKSHARQFRSFKDSDLILILLTKYKSFADRLFSVAALTIWNLLPKATRQQESLLKFKCDLKTPLYRQAYADLCPNVIKQS